MRLMILENSRLRATVQASHGTVSIGSSPECGVHLPDPRISAHQATLTRDDGGVWWLEVVDSKIPTCLNRAVQKTRSKLRHADEIAIGVYSIRLFMESNKTREELRRERMQALTKRYGEGLPLGTMAQQFDNGMEVSREHIEQMAMLAVRLEQSDSVRNLITPLLRSLLRTFEGRRVWVGIRSADRGEFEWTLGLAQNGEPCERPPFSKNMQARCLSNTQYLCVPEVPATDIGSAMAVPLACQPGNLGMLYVENGPKDPAFDASSLSALSAMACCVAMPVEDVLRKSRAKRREAVSTEQTIARATQQALTLKALPQWDELQLAAYRHAGSATCCDYYDVVQLRDRTASVIVARLAVENAAVPRYMAELRAAFRASALYAEPPHLFARALNWISYDGAAGHGIELTCAWIAPATGKVQYCTAGNGVILGRVHSDGTCEMIPPGTTPPIGRTRGPTYVSQALELAAGDTLVMATQGVNAATNAEGKAFGMSGLEENLCDGLGDTPSHVLTELAQELTDFVSGGDCKEDVTVLLIQRT